MSGRIVLAGGDGPWHGGQITPIAHCVLAPNPSPWTLDGTNTWIIGPKGGACVVVDPGPLESGHLEAIESQLEAGGHRVTSVLLTHGHVDHSQGAREFAERHRVAVRAWDERLSHASPSGGVPEVLSANEVVDIDGLTLRVLATPGHTSDSICLLVEHEVLTGDTVLGRGTSLVAHPDGRLADYLESLMRLSRLCADAGVERILPGHGPVLPDPVGVVEYYLQHRVERLEQVQRAVRQGATSAREVVEIVYADVPREVWPAAETTVMAQLEYLSSQGELD